jgi:hypothetical protein
VPRFLSAERLVLFHFIRISSLDGKLKPDSFAGLVSAFESEKPSLIVEKRFDIR